MAKQAELSKLVTELQRGRMDSLVAWMGKAEAILASLAEPPGSREELAEQCGRKESLLEEEESAETVCLLAARQKALGAFTCTLVPNKALARFSIVGRRLGSACSAKRIRARS